MPLNKHSIAFIDFDKTIYDLQIPDYEEQRAILARTVKEKFQVETSLYPILEDTDKLAAKDARIKKYIYDHIDGIEQKATGYFYDYAEKLLKKLSLQMPVVVVSNNSGDVITQRLKEANLDQQVRYVYGRGTFDYYKPMGKVLEYCCRNLSLTPAGADNFLFMGDSWRDYSCAADFAAKNNLSYTFIHPKHLTHTDIF